MNYNRWLDYIEDINEFPFMAYFSILRDMKCNEFWVLGKNEKLEVIQIENGECTY